MRYRIPRHSRWLSVLVCTPPAIAIFIVSMPLMKLIVSELIRRGVVNPFRTPGDAYTSISFFITAILMSVIYRKYRWRIVDDPTQYCVRCGYNLTGNESGTCPECGMVINS